MALTDLLKTQKRIMDSIYPPNVRTILENQRKWHAISDVSHLKNAMQVANTEKIVANYVSAFNAYQSVDKDITQIANIEKIVANYASAFIAIESISKHFEVFEEITSRLNYSFINYDFLYFSDEADEEEIKIVEEIAVNQSKSVQRIITDIYKDNSNLLKVGPREFEEMVAELLKSQGFNVELTKQTRDNGYDIIALQSIGSNFPLKFLVECKRFTEKKVSVDIIRSFKEVIQTEQANKGIIVTTSYFTRDAIKKKLETPYLLDYKDKDAVLNWVTEYCRK